MCCCGGRLHQDSMIGGILSQGLVGFGGGHDYHGCLGAGASDAGAYKEEVGLLRGRSNVQLAVPLGSAQALFE